MSLQTKGLDEGQCMMEVMWYRYGTDYCILFVIE